jgi:hypothetical protein
MGHDTLERKANAQIDQNGFYAPDSVTSDGAAYINKDDNFDNLRAALNQQSNAEARVGRRPVGAARPIALGQKAQSQEDLHLEPSSTDTDDEWRRNYRYVSRSTPRPR